MKKAINQFSLPQSSMEDFLESSKVAGFDGVEVIVSEDGVLTPETSKETIDKIAREAKSIGIEICSVCSALLYTTYPITSPNLEIRNKGISILDRCIEIASILEADTVLVVPGMVTEETFYLDALDVSKQVIEKLGSKAKNYGINLALENGGMKFLASPVEFREFIDSLNNPYIGAYFDTANAMIEGYPEQWIHILGRRIKKVHFKDFKASVRIFPEAFTQLLQGDVNWQKVMNELRKIEYNDYIVAEIPPYNIYPKKLLKNTLTNMNLILSGVDNM